MSLLSGPAWMKFARKSLILATLIGIVALTYAIWGDQFIRDAFQASVDGTPSYSFIDHTRHNLEYYQKRADLIVWQYVVIGIPLTLMLWFSLVHFARKLVTISNQSSVFVDQAEKRRRESILAFVIYVGLTVLYFSPLIGSFNTHLIGPPEDNMAGYWSLWWAHDMWLENGHSLTFTNHIYFPEGTSLYYFAWSFYNLGVSFVLRLFLDPVAVYNAVILHGYPIAGLGAFMLVRRVTGNWLVALTCGFVFAFSPNHFIRSQHHIHINSIQFIPFFVMYFIDGLSTKRTRSLVLASVFFFLNTICDWTYMIMGGYFILFCYIYLAIKNRKWWVRDFAKRAIVVVVPTLLLVSPWMFNMIKIGMAHPEVEVGGRNTYVADLAGLAIPGTYHISSNLEVVQAANDSYSGNTCESTVYLGAIAIILVLTILRQTIVASARYLLGCGAFLVMSLGPQLHILGKLIPIALPYTVLSYLPFISNVRAPARFIVYVYLFWSVLLGISLNEVLRKFRTNHAKWLVAVSVVGLLFLDFYSFRVPRTTVTAPEILQRITADSSGVAILNLPLGYENSTRYMMEQTIHSLSIVQGVATRKIGVSLIDTLSLDNLAKQQEQLRASGVKFIAIHHELEGAEKLDLDSYRRTYRVVANDSLCTVLLVD